MGVDNYDIDYLDRRGILLSNTPDVLTETTADTGFALILATARRVVELAGWVRAGEWKKSVGAAQFGTDVHGKTLGIVGMGRIGEALARRGTTASACACCTTAIARSPTSKNATQRATAPSTRCSRNPTSSA